MDNFCDDNRCYFERLPFYWHPLDDYRNDKFQEFLPFELFYDQETGVLRQKIVKEVVEVLTLAYQQGSEIVGLMDNCGIGYDYANDFLDFMNRVIGLDNFHNKEILEIGCGTGYLLRRLKMLGANVTGYEPGFSRIGKYDVPVFERTFPSEEVNGKQFDCIIAYGVLEHAVDLDNLAMAIYNCLSDDGVVVVSVPDCESYIENGDISMLIHEHFSYFTRESFSAFAQKKCFTICEVQRAGFGGGIYFCLKKKRHDVLSQKYRDTMTKDMFKKIDQNIKKMQRFIYQCNNTMLGVYSPIRALNILSLCKDSIYDANVSLQFFDDSVSLIGKYLPGFTVKIEGRESLLKHPPDKVIVYSYSFGKKIVEELKRTLPQQVEVFDVRDI